MNPSSVCEVFVRWLLRIASGYLLWFGIALYITFMYEVSGGIIHDADIIKAIGLGLIFSMPLFLATLPLKDLSRRLVLFLIIIMTIFYTGLAIAKPVIHYFIGTVSHVLGIVYLLKIKQNHRATQN